MNPTLLRRWMRKYGTAGAILVGCCLLFHHVWTKRRGVCIAVSLAIAFGISVVFFRQVSSQHRAAPTSLSSVLPLTSPVPPFSAPALSEHPQLLDRATRVADTHEWALRNHNYYWLSDHEVLYSQEANDSDQVFCENLTTHRRQSLPRLARLTNGLAVKHSSVWLSPDRRWLLWDDFDTTQVIVTSIDGKRHSSLPYPGGKVGWMGDSRHWVVMAFYDGIDRSVTRYDRRARSRVPLGNTNLSGIPSIGYPCVICGDHYLANVLQDDSGMIPRVDIYEGNLKHLDLPAHKHTVSLPPNSYFDEVVYSPSCDRIAWLLPAHSTPANAEHAPECAGTEARIGIWVSNINGSNMHEVGSVAASANMHWFTLPNRICWLPNGRSLSFLYQDALWTVPVE